MAKKIIVLAQDLNSNPAQFVFSAAFWAAVPSQRKIFYANPLASSAVPEISADELTAIQQGAVKEVVDTVSVANGGQDLATVWPAIEEALRAKFADAQANVDSFNPWVRSGSVWDGTAWSEVVVA